VPASKSIVDSPVFAVVLALLAILIGLLGSAYQSEIATAFPFKRRGPWGPISISAAGFWVALAVLGIGLFFRQRADDRAREELRQSTVRVEEATRTIQTSVQTLPGRAFLDEVSTQVASSRAVLDKLRRSPLRDREPIDISLGVRLLLKMLARLAASYDERLNDQGRPVTYTANVFVAFDAAKVDWSQVVFTTPEEAKTALHVLRLRADWEADNRSELIPNPSLTYKLTLPVPAQAKVGEKWAALPGAPVTFLTGDSTGYDDTSTLADWCKAEGRYPTPVIQQLATYFKSGPGATIRSFISAPIAVGTQRFGVVNIHADAPFVLAGNRRHTFLAAAAPLLFDLAELVQALIDAELREGQGSATLDSGTGNV
jgi:hypothetical protein